MQSDLHDRKVSAISSELFRQLLPTTGRLSSLGGFPTDFAKTANILNLELKQIQQDNDGARIFIQLPAF